MLFHLHVLWICLPSLSGSVDACTHLLVPLRACPFCRHRVARCASWWNLSVAFCYRRSEFSLRTDFALRSSFSTEGFLGNFWEAMRCNFFENDTLCSLKPPPHDLRVQSIDHAYASSMSKLLAPILSRNLTTFMYTLTRTSYGKESPRIPLKTVRTKQPFCVRLVWHKPWRFGVDGICICIYAYIYSLLPLLVVHLGFQDVKK